MDAPELAAKRYTPPGRTGIGRSGMRPLIFDQLLGQRRVKVALAGT